MPQRITANEIRAMSASERRELASVLRRIVRNGEQSIRRLQELERSLPRKDIQRTIHNSAYKVTESYGKKAKESYKAAKAAEMY